MAELSPKRVTVESPLLSISPTHALARLSDLAAGVNERLDWHLTILHVGRLPELVSEIEHNTKRYGQRELIQDRLVRWLAQLPISAPLVAYSSEVELYGPPHARVAALNILPNELLMDLRNGYFGSLIDVLESLAVQDARQFIRLSQALGFTSTSWQPHVSIGSPLLSESSYPVSYPKLRLTLGPSHVRNLQHVISTSSLHF